MILLAICCVLLVAALIYEKRINTVREKEWALERGALLTRIQRPEWVPSSELPEPTGQPLHIPLDDDAAFGDYVEARSAGEVS